MEKYMHKHPEKLHSGNHDKMRSVMNECEKTVVKN